jgi:hypothetical protein
MKTQTDGKLRTVFSSRLAEGSHDDWLILQFWAHTPNRINESVRTEFSEERQIIGYRKGRGHYAKQTNRTIPGQIT